VDYNLRGDEVKGCAMGIEEVAEPLFCVVLRLLCIIGIVNIDRTGVFTKGTLNDLLSAKRTNHAWMSMKRSWGISQESTLRV
jgi:hypothetical protein